MVVCSRLEVDSSLAVVSRHALVFFYVAKGPGRWIDYVRLFCCIPLPLQ
ncbi:MAG: hypothetical protein ACLFS8_03830 [Clostridia bacterium]